eukprot:TRINITY_DN15616_c0_g1_i1.p1 TRINITY_DN15616_c0_g1~~TRINITY_DN15616_c0_g1_i1.p1  ORF type:complete len:383 (-),score=69.59 TRINITY_DN15616_c0_g1_i1:291-1439(-)
MGCGASRLPVHVSTECEARCQENPPTFEDIGSAEGPESGRRMHTESKRSRKRGEKGVSSPYAVSSPSRNCSCGSNSSGSASDLSSDEFAQDAVTVFRRESFRPNVAGERKLSTFPKAMSRVSSRRSSIPDFSPRSEEEFPTHEKKDDWSIETTWSHATSRPKCSHSICHLHYQERIDESLIGDLFQIDTDSRPTGSEDGPVFVSKLFACLGKRNGVTIRWEVNQKHLLSNCEFFLEGLQEGMRQVILTRGTPLEGCMHEYFGIYRSSSLHMSERIVGEDRAFFFSHPCRSLIQSQMWTRLKKEGKTSVFFRVWTRHQEKVTPSQWYEFPASIDVHSLDEEGTELRRIGILPYQLPEEIINQPKMMPVCQRNCFGTLVYPKIK